MITFTILPKRSASRPVQPIIQHASGVVAAPQQGNSPGSLPTPLFIPTANPIAIAAGVALSRFAAAGPQPVQSYGGGFSTTASPTPQTPQAVSSVGGSIDSPSMLPDSSFGGIQTPVQNRVIAKPDPDLSHQKVGNHHDLSRPHVTPAAGGALIVPTSNTAGTGSGYYGTGSGYYGTGSGYYSSTSTRSNYYGSIDSPDTQSGTSSQYSSDLPPTSNVANTGSAYYGTTPATSTNQAQSSPPTAFGAQAAGTFDLQYDTRTCPDGTSLSDDVGNGVTLQVVNPSKTIKSINWTVPNADTAVNASRASGTVEQLLPSPYSNKPITNFQGQTEGSYGFFWNTMPGNNKVTVAVTFTDNTTASKSLNVNVVAPQLISFSRTYLPMHVATVKDYDPDFAGNPVAGLTQAATDNFGRYTAQQAGDQFSAQVDGTKLPIGGFIFMEQTVADVVLQKFNALFNDNGVVGNTYETSNTVQVKNSQGQVSTKLTPTVPMLDVLSTNKTLAYAGASAAAPAGAKSAVYLAQDSPNVAFGGNSPGNYAATPQGLYVTDVTRTASFVSTLMFQTPGGLPVPVANMTWNIGGRATFQNTNKPTKTFYLSTGSWTLSNQTPAQGGIQPGAATTKFPSWTGSTDTTEQTVTLQSPMPR